MEQPKEVHGQFHFGRLAAQHNINDSLIDILLVLYLLRLDFSYKINFFILVFS